MLAQLAAWMSYLQETRKLQHVATVGFSVGARIGLVLAAQNRRVAGHVCYYPLIEEPKAVNQEFEVLTLAKEVRCPIQLVCPGKDERTMSYTYERLTGVLRKRAAPTSVHYYPDASDGFMEGQGQAAPGNQGAMRLSWAQAVSFLRACATG